MIPEVHYGGKKSEGRSQKNRKRLRKKVGFLKPEVRILGSEFGSRKSRNRDINSFFHGFLHFDVEKRKLESQNLKSGKPKNQVVVSLISKFLGWTSEVTKEEGWKEEVRKVSFNVETTIVVSEWICKLRNDCYSGF